MYDLPVEARIDITPTRKHQPIQATDRRPEHGKDIVKGILIGEDAEGVVVTKDDGQRRNDDGRAPGLKDGMDGRRISRVHRPVPLAQAATGCEEANAWKRAGPARLAVTTVGCDGAIHQTSSLRQLPNPSA